MTPIDYLYYRFYQTILKTPNKDIAGYLSAILVTLMNGLNFFEIYMILRMKNIVPELITKPETLIWFTGGLLAIYCAFFFLMGRYRRIKTHFDNESFRHEQIGKFVVWLYVVVTIVLFFILIHYKEARI